MVFKVALALGIAFAFPALDLAVVMLVLTVAVFGVAVAYEALRTAGTGRSDEVPPPLTPALVGIWLVIGGSYAVRGVGGLALAVPLGQHPALAVAAFITMWSFGIAFVTARWAIEAIAFA